MCIRDRYEAATVLASAQARLLQAYGVEARDLAQPVTAAAS